jgi:hypothetical protein
MNPDRICKGTNRDGSACRKVAIEGTEFCRWHGERKPRVVLKLAMPSANLFRLWQMLDDLQNKGVVPTGPDLLEVTSSDPLQVKMPDGEIPPGMAMEGQLTRRLRATFMPVEDGLNCVLAPGHTLFFRPEQWEGMMQPGEPLYDMLIPPQALPAESADDAELAEPPEKIRQQTWPEAKEINMALAHGPHGLQWMDAEGEVALIHAMPDSPLQTRFEADLLPDLWGRLKPQTCDDLRAYLREAGTPAVILLSTCLALVLDGDRPRKRMVTIDDLIAAIGWTPRSTKERQGRRDRVWSMLRTMGSMRVIGLRRGTWKDPFTKETINVRTNDPLITLGRRVEPEQRELYPDGTPIAVAIGPGDWLEEHGDRRELLAFFGNVRQIAAIPAGKPSGAWAQSIALALNQTWREQAARPNTKVYTAGEDNRPVVRMRPVTRRELLTLYPPEPQFSAEAILGGNDPKRARKYWDDAIRLLKPTRDNPGAGIIGWYKELVPLPQTRIGWQTAWLDQPLDIRPRGEDKAAMIDLARKGEAARRARKKRAEGKKPAS